MSWDITITSDPSDLIGGYTKPSSPLRLHGVSSGTLVEGISLIKYCFGADNYSVLTMHMKAYFMRGLLPTNIWPLSPQCLCLVSGGNFITTGTTATLCLPNKPHLTMELDSNSHLPYSMGTRSLTVLKQDHVSQPLCHRQV